MNYQEAEKALRRRRPTEDGEEDRNYFEDRDQAQGIVILSIARNLERIANALEKASD